MLNILEKQGLINKWDQLQQKLENKLVETLWVAGPENQKVYPDLKEKIQLFETYCQNVIWWTTHPLPVSNEKLFWQIPLKTFFEKTGTFINFSGQSQKSRPFKHSSLLHCLSLNLCKY